MSESCMLIAYFNSVSDRQVKKVCYVKNETTVSASVGVHNFTEAIDSNLIFAFGPFKENTMDEAKKKARKKIILGRDPVWILLEGAIRAEYTKNSDDKITKVTAKTTDFDITVSNDSELQAQANYLHGVVGKLKAKKHTYHIVATPIINNGVAQILGHTDATPYDEPKKQAPMTISGHMTISDEENKEETLDVVKYTSMQHRMKVEATTQRGAIKHLQIAGPFTSSFYGSPDIQFVSKHKLRFFWILGDELIKKTDASGNVLSVKSKVEASMDAVVEYLKSELDKKTTDEDRQEYISGKLMDDNTGGLYQSPAVSGAIFSKFNAAGYFKSPKEVGRVLLKMFPNSNSPLPSLYDQKDLTPTKVEMPKQILHGDLEIVQSSSSDDQWDWTFTPSIAFQGRAILPVLATYGEDMVDANGDIIYEDDDETPMKATNCLQIVVEEEDALLWTSEITGTITVSKFSTLKRDPFSVLFDKEALDSFVDETYSFFGYTICASIFATCTEVMVNATWTDSDGNEHSPLPWRDFSEYTGIDDLPEEIQRTWQASHDFKTSLAGGGSGEFALIRWLSNQQWWLDLGNGLNALWEIILAFDKRTFGFGELIMGIIDGDMERIGFALARLIVVIGVIAAWSMLGLPPVGAALVLASLLVSMCVHFGLFDKMFGDGSFGAEIFNFIGSKLFSSSWWGNRIYDLAKWSAEAVANWFKDNRDSWFVRSLWGALGLNGDPEGTFSGLVNTMNENNPYVSYTLSTVGDNVSVTVKNKPGLLFSGTDASFATTYDSSKNETKLYVWGDNSAEKLGPKPALSSDEEAYQSSITFAWDTNSQSSVATFQFSDQDGENKTLAKIRLTFSATPSNTPYVYIYNYKNDSTYTNIEDSPFEGQLEAEYDQINGRYELNLRDSNGSSLIHDNYYKIEIYNSNQFSGTATLMVVPFYDTNIKVPSPMALPRRRNVLRIATGRAHTMAIMDDGSVYTCGFNSVGQLGVGDLVSRNTFTQVELPGIATSIHCNWGWEGNSSTPIAFRYTRASSFAILNDKTLYAWGSNTHGQLGLSVDTTTDHTQTSNENLEDIYYYTSPQKIDFPTGITGIEKITGGEHFTLALLSDGKVYAWGDNEKGYLGTYTADSSGATTDSDGSLISPVTYEDHYSGASDAKSIDFGDYTPMDVQAGVKTTLVLLEKDSKKFVVGFGESNANNGFLGDGDSSANHKGAPFVKNAAGEPVRGIIQAEGADLEVVSIHVGNKHAFAMTAEGALYAWGDNSKGQLGLGNTTKQNSPQRVQGILAAEVSAGYKHTLLTTTTGEIRAFGENGNEQLGTSSGGNNVTSVPTTDHLTGLLGWTTTTDLTIN